MSIYVTKTWGFSSPSGPLQFSQRGWRDRARSVLQPGDLVVIVGTKGEETAIEERGKILGLMEPTKHLVSSLDYDLSPRPRDFNKEGQYRWPFGLELQAAWRFEEPRIEFSEISSRLFGMNAALGIVTLLRKEAEAILSLKREVVPLLRPVRAEARLIGADLARRRAAPPPTTMRRGIMHIRRAPAFTYAMAIEGASAPAFKIGWAFDLISRERQFNQASMPAVGGVRYRVVLRELWDTAIQAFDMEQALLHRFDAYRHAQNREVIFTVRHPQIEAAWIDFLANKRRKR